MLKFKNKLKNIYIYIKKNLLHTMYSKHSVLEVGEGGEVL